MCTRQSLLDNDVIEHNARAYNSIEYKTKVYSYSAIRHDTKVYDSGHNLKMYNSTGSNTKVYVAIRDKRKRSI